MKEVLIGVLGVVAGTIVTSLLKWPARAWSRFKVWWYPDHQSLYSSGGWALMATTSSDARIRVQVVCAPDRSIGRDTLDPDAGIELVHTELPGEFPPDPVFSMPGHGVRFEKSNAGLMDGYFWVWKTGRLDYDTYIEPRIDNENIILPILEVLDVIAIVARIAKGPSYSNAFGRTRLRARRFDWFIGVSPSITKPDGVTSPWTEIEFPGRSPRRAAGVNQQPFCPSGGYARDALNSWKSIRPVEDVLRFFLVDFIQQNGFHDATGAIEDTLEAFSRRTKSQPIDFDSDRLLRPTG
jgi:hypothetical protein